MLDLVYFFTYGFDNFFFEKVCLREKYFVYLEKIYIMSKKSWPNLPNIVNKMGQYFYGSILMQVP